MKIPGTRRSRMNDDVFGGGGIPQVEDDDKEIPESEEDDLRLDDMLSDHPMDDDDVLEVDDDGVRLDPWYL